MQPASQVQQNVPRHAGAMMRGRNGLPVADTEPRYVRPLRGSGIGFGGQAIAIVPSIRVIVVQTVDLTQSAQAVRTSFVVAVRCCSP